MDTVIGTRVRVHLNLHRGDWSISDPRTGLVLRSATDVTLEGVTFHVSETTRQRIIERKRRRVHAWAIGQLLAVDTAPDLAGLEPVTYNPFRAPTFTTTEGEPVTAAPLMHFVERKGWRKP
jgi:hypothetical protein